jgi:hypothetical protein
MLLCPVLIGVDLRSSAAKYAFFWPYAKIKTKY